MGHRSGRRGVGLGAASTPPAALVGSSEPAHRPRRRPTIEDVARVAGVSLGTVSRAINGGHSVRPAVMATVNAAIAELGYSVNQAARNLARGRTGSVAFVISERQEHLFEDPNFGLFVRIFSKELRREGVHLLVTAAQDPNEESFLAEYLSGGHVDGALLALPHQGEPLLTRLLDRRLPVVVLGRPIDPAEAERASWVAVEEEHAALAAGSYLAAVRSGPIATITGPLDTSSGQGRLAGFRRGVGNRFRRDLVVTGDWSAASGELGAAALLDREPGLGALFVASDLMAVGAMRVLNRRGLRVPDDIAICGFDDSPSAQMTDPPLTTVRNPMEQTAHEAMRILLGLMDGPAPPLHVLLPTELVVRAST